MIFVSDLAPPKPEAPPSKLAAVLCDGVHKLHARRLNKASELITEMIARAHDPRDGDDAAAVAAIDVLAAAGQYSMEQFTDDAFTAVAIRNLRADDDAGEIEREKLFAERNELVADFERRTKLPRDPRHDYGPAQKRLAEIERDLPKLDAKHDARNRKFRELSARSQRVYQALKQSGVDLRNR